MTYYSHIVAKQVIDINLNSRVSAFEIQNKVRDVYYKQIVRLLDEEFAQMSHANNFIRINQLEIDLGNLRSDQLETEMAEKFKILFREKMGELRATQTPSGYGEYPSDISNNVVVKEKSDSDFELISHYLLTGTLPWWAKPHEKELLRKIFLQQINKSSSPLIEFIRVNIARQDFSKRLVFQFPDSHLVTLTKALYGGAASEIQDDVLELIKLLENLKSILLIKIHPRLLAWQSSWEHNQMPAQTHLPLVGDMLLKVSRESDTSLVTLFLTVAKEIARKPLSIRSQGKLSIETLKLTFIKFLRARSFTSQTSQPFKQSWIELVTTAQIIGILPEDLRLKSSPQGMIQIKNYLRKIKGSERSVAENLIEELGQISADLDSSEAIGIQTNLPKTRKSKRSKPIIYNSESISAKDADLRSTIFSHSKPHVISPPVDIQDKWPSPDYNISAGEKIYLENAGLILLSSYLPSFFTHVGLVTESKFVDQQAAYRAIHLLQYLSCGKKDDMENKLALNKLLCSININDPVDSFIEFSDFLVREADTLLESVIKHWSALKSTSLQGLRNMFLLRNGILTRQDFGWRLQVERNAYDILLDRLPWSFSTVRLPWMKSIISTEW